MRTPELAQLEMLAQVDQLIDRLRRWVEPETPWEPLDHCRALLRRLLARIETLRIRLEAPLIVATFGGTGTGKSALVNALVGRECTPSGRQRPTTTRPVLIAHPQTELEFLGLPLDELDVIRADTPLLRDVILIDCPDPDTTETETAGSNLARLHRLLPFCDVLIYTSTQQKYRSARVIEELGQAATGCRLVFVQTCADLDEDIRDDWRAQLDGRYQVPDIFFVDSLRALREQQSNQRPGGEFRRLQDLLATELAASHRTQIRRANLVDLVQAALDHCRAHAAAHAPALDRLSECLEEQHRRLIGLMSDRLREELLAGRGLWERRLTGEVTQRWGVSPFAMALRIYNSLGGLITSASLWRARTSAQMALIGAVHGARWLTAKAQELQGEDRLVHAAALGLDADVLRETQMVVTGFVQDARLEGGLLEGGSIDRLQEQAARVEDRFLGDAGRRVDEIISDLAARHSGWLVRSVYEFLLMALLVYVLGWPAYNFFYAHPWLGRPLISSDFYIHGAVYVLLWSGILVMMFTHRLRGGLVKRVGEMARQMAESRLSAGLFPRLEQAIADVHLQRERLEAMVVTTAEIRREIAAAGTLGTQLSPYDVPKARLEAAGVK